MEFIRDPSLVLDLPFRRLDGASFMDKSAYGHQCTNFGSKWTPYGRSFDGVNDYIDCGNDASLNLTRYTIELWIKPTTAGVNLHQELIQKKPTEPAGEENYCLFIHITDRWVGHILTVDGVRDWFSTPGNDVPVGQWTHIVGTFDGSFARTYINEVERASLSKPGDATPSAGILSININDFPGLIDEVRIYNRALTPLEIQRNYLADK